MRWLNSYQGLGLETEDQVFDHLLGSLSDAIRTWDYFVNWDKVYKNVAELEVQLNIWNYLIGKENFDAEFRSLVRRYPEIVKAIPSMVVRDGQNSQAYQVIQGEEINLFDFSSPANSDEEVEKALNFVKASGLARLFGDSGIKNFVDYLIGVEAGVDSNGRKNRSGSGMESILEGKIASICDRRGWKYMEQASPEAIKQSWGVDFKTGLSSRRFDFAVLADGQVSVIEVNIYNGGGSKLKATAGEFTTLHQSLEATPVKLIWVTDGKGWGTTARPLRDAFDKVDFVLNLSLIDAGCLEEAITIR